MHSKNIRAYLDSNAGLAALLPHAERLIELRQIYGQLMPQQLLRYSSIVNYKRETVVIFAENNAIAAKIKLLSPRLVNDFSKRGVEVTGIRLEVQPRQESQLSGSRKRAELSQGGSEILGALAARLPDSRLKQAIKKIAGRNVGHENLD